VTGRNITSDNSKLPAAPPALPLAEAETLRRICRPPDHPPGEYAAIFPIQWYEEFLQLLRQKNIQTITYRELFQQCDDWDYQSGYAHEYLAWRKKRDRQTTYLLIQHDVDYVPSFARRMVALEALYGVRSNIFLFNELYRTPMEGNPPIDLPYDVDHEFFTAAERAGYVVGYHQNALAMADFDLDAAMDRFRQDVAQLSRHYHIDFFCPHGGPGLKRGDQIIRNHDVPIPPELRQQIRWVYNRYGLRFAGRWSDGGIWKLNDTRRLAQLDIINEFVAKMKPGYRYFALVHPQLWGYNISRDYAPALLNQPWYRDVCRRYSIAI
jgi:hypothetical protein